MGKALREWMDELVSPLDWSQDPTAAFIDLFTRVGFVGMAIGCTGLALFTVWLVASSIVGALA